MPTTDPAPLPIRELPEEVVIAIQVIENDISDDLWNSVHFDYLRRTICAALDERDVALRTSAQLLGATLAERDALRERCERLRRVADVASLAGRTPDIVLEMLADLHEDDYADDLRPRGGDEQ